MEGFQNFDDLGIKIPDAGFGEVAVGAFEKCIAIQLGQVRCDAIQDAIDQIAPPIFIVVLARTIDRRAGWNFFPTRSERGIERTGIEAKTDSSRHKRVMMTDALRQINQSAGRIKEDCLDEIVLAFHWDATVL